MNDDRTDRTARIGLPIAGEHSALPPEGMDRRQALKIMAMAAAAPAMFTACAPDENEPAIPEAPEGNPLARGDAWDPDLLDPEVPWERVLEADELATLAVLCDLIIPADDRSPAASELGAPDFIDEWVSAPYDGNRDDRVLIRGGLIWLDGEAARRSGTEVRFRDLEPDAQGAICDDICHQPDAAPEHRFAARFFDRVRDLTATAFYTTPEGMDDLQYIGNSPSNTWELPPPEVLAHLGLESEV